MDLEELFQRAALFHRSGESEQAERLYLQILQTDPDDLNARHRLGILRAQQGRNLEALELIGAVLQANPDAPDAQSDYGNILKALSRHEEALASYDRALAIRPDFAMALSNRGVVLAEMKRFDEALASYDKALGINPDYAMGWNNRGNVLFDLKRFDEALASYDKALGVDPDYADALNGRGNALRGLNRFEDALESLNRALAIRPDYFEAWNNRANTLLDFRRYEEALTSYDKALAIMPENIETLINRGSALMCLRRGEDALASYDKVLSIAPDNAEALTMRGTLLRGLNRLQESLASYDKALAINPDHEIALNNRGITLRNMGRVEDALENCMRVLDRNSDHLATCEAICRDVLDAEPGNETARKICRVIATKIQASNQVTESKANRYLLIKSWEAGFWSNISHVLGCLLLAEITGRTPVTNLGKDCLYSDDSKRDAFGIYFRPVSSVTLQDIDSIDVATFFPSKWNRENLADDNIARWYGSGSCSAAINFLNRPEKIVVCDFYIGVLNVEPWIPADHPMHGKTCYEIYRYLIEKYLKPSAAVCAACDAFFSEHLEGAPFVAVHLRGSDKYIEDPDLLATIEACLSKLALIDPAWRIFLLTDDLRLLAKAKDNYGKRVIATNCQRTNTSTGVHFSSSTNPVQAGLEVMIDTYLALRADRFIGSGASNVSAMISVLKEWKPGDCTLIGRSVHTKWDLNCRVR